MGMFFPQFHKMLYPHISLRGGRTIPYIYNLLFSWMVPSDRPPLDASDEETLFYSAPQVIRWTTNKEELPVPILQQAVNNMDVAADTYAEAFYDLLYKEMKPSGQSIEMLDSDMRRFLEGFPVSFFDTNGELEKDNKYYLASYALVTTLIYDRVGNDGKSKKDRLIESGLYMALSNALETCQENNVIFSTPFLLNALFQKEFSLLRRSLNKVHDGLGEDWEMKIQRYTEAKTHRPFDKTRLCNQEIVFLAKLMAVKDHRLNSQCSAVATEETLCRALPLCRKSRTITEMWNQITRYGIDQAEWTEIVKRCEAERCSTTNHGILNPVNLI